MSQASSEEEFQQAVKAVLDAITAWNWAVGAKKQADHEGIDDQVAQAARALQAAKTVKAATAVVEAMTAFQEVARRLASSQHE